MFDLNRKDKEIVAEFRTKLQSDPAWTTRGLVRIFQYQTAHEQEVQQTEDHNNVGFTGCDAEILTSFAKQVLNGRTLSQKQLAIAFKKMPKYAGQLLKIVKGQQ
jgi:hypothetical protein